MTLDLLDINPGLQTRALPALPATADGNTLSGYAIRWNEWTPIAGGAYLERFAAGSWDDAIASGNVKVMAEHGMDPTIGLKPIASLRSLTDDGTGAAYEAELLTDAPYVDTLRPGLRAGLYGSSFRFNVPEGGQTINRRPGKSTHNPGGVPEVTITRANIVELGPTSLPAYAGSTASLRSIDATPPEATAPAPQPKEGKAAMKKSVEELVAEATGFRNRIIELNAEYEGRAFTSQAKQEVEDNKRYLGEHEALIEELRSRKALLDEIAVKPDHVENERTVPQARRSDVTRGEDIWDFSSIRSRAFGNAGGVEREIRERALRAIEICGLEGETRSRLEQLVHSDPGYGEHILKTGSPAYRSGFAKVVTGRAGERTQDELRAMSETGAAGGFATLPYVLDPTLIKTGNLAINPLRGISRVVQIVGTGVWKGISVGAVVASYDAEASAVSDDAPTFAQPSISTFPARAFVPYSYEIGEDYNGSLLTDLGDLISDAKDTLEANKFTLGTGTAEPAGLITGATNTVATAGAAAFARGDLDLLDNALPSRYQANASLVGNRAILGRIRAFDTTNGNTLYGPNAQLAVPTGTEARVSMTPLGIPAYQLSDMVTTLTTGSKILVEGDFRNFVIVDRIGLQVEYIPNLFDPTTGRPTGQRGVMAHWRSGSGVVNAAAFRVLVTA